MNKLSHFIVFLICISFLACTAGVHDVSSNFTEEPAGFLLGLWHGIIAPFSFILSLFMDDIAIYEINNLEIWYDLGFLIGIGSFTSASAKGGRKLSKK